MRVPKKLQAILWSADVSKLDTKRDKYYIIHQVLIYGRMEEINWLFKQYKKQEIKDVFLCQPYKSYPERTFYFIKNYLLDLKEDINKDAYVTSFFGSVRQRTTTSFQKA